MSMTTEDYLRFLNEVERALNSAIEDHRHAVTEARLAELEGMRREVAETRAALHALEETPTGADTLAAVGMR